MRKLKLWFKIRHEDYDVLELEWADNTSAGEKVRRIQKDGGLWYDMSFIPYHSITSIEIVS